MDLRVTRKKIGDQVYDSMLAMILDGKLPQGSRIDYTDMSKKFETSRLPLREAVQRLSSDGLLETTPNGGTYVIELHEDEIRYLFAMRRFIESEAIRTRFEHIDRENILKLRKVFLEEEDVLEGRSSGLTEKNVASTDLLLHEEIVLGDTENKVISHFSQLVYNYTQLAQRMNVRSVSSNHEHLAIVDAILQNDKDAAYKAVMTHLNNVEQSILEGLRKKSNQ